MRLLSRRVGVGNRFGQQPAIHYTGKFGASFPVAAARIVSVGTARNCARLAAPSDSTQAAPASLVPRAPRARASPRSMPLRSRRLPSGIIPAPVAPPSACSPQTSLRSRRRSSRSADRRQTARYFPSPTLARPPCPSTRSSLPRRQLPWRGRWSPEIQKRRGGS